MLLSILDEPDGVQHDSAPGPRSTPRTLREYCDQHQWPAPITGE
jgi:hypothetical protein